MTRQIPQGGSGNSTGWLAPAQSKLQLQSPKSTGMRSDLKFGIEKSLASMQGTPAAASAFASHMLTYETDFFGRTCTSKERSVQMIKNRKVKNGFSFLGVQRLDTIFTSMCPEVGLGFLLLSVQRLV